jgi:redox-sensitive bicupin YhaK (pirin superfamily)
MSIHFSPVLAARPRVDRDGFSAVSLELNAAGERASPIASLDEFRLRAPTSGRNHPQALSAVTYVFDDSPAGLRRRDSLGNDLVVSPGGVVWTQAGSGVIHEELPAEPGRELHGLQLFVHLGPRNYAAAPRVVLLRGTEVPEWTSDAEDRVRVVMGRFRGVVSPLASHDSLTLLDIELRRGISLPLLDGHAALVYVRSGRIRIRADGRERRVAARHALALSGAGGGSLTFEAVQTARFLVLSRPEVGLAGRVPPAVKAA